MKTVSWEYSLLLSVWCSWWFMSQLIYPNCTLITHFVAGSYCSLYINSWTVKIAFAKFHNLWVSSLSFAICNLGPHPAKTTFDSSDCNTEILLIRICCHSPQLFPFESFTWFHKGYSVYLFMFMQQHLQVFPGLCHNCHRLIYDLAVWQHLQNKLLFSCKCVCQWDRVLTFLQYLQYSI